MAVKLKLKRMGKIRAPQYRIIVADSRTKRDGRAIEEIGKYHPKQEPSLIQVDSERVQHWLGVGAQPTEPVLKLLKITGDWQRFKGIQGGEGTLKVAESKPDKTELFNTALAAVHKEPQAEATTAKKKSTKKSSAKKAAATKASPADEEAKAAAKKSPAKKAAAKKSTAKKSTSAADPEPSDGDKAAEGAHEAVQPKDEAPTSTDEAASSTQES